MKKVLVVDIGGTNVKAMISRDERRKFASGGSLTPRQLHDILNGKLDDWKYDVVSVGFPAPVRNGRILCDPKNLGKGWTRFNFEKAFGKPVRVMNDAAMQALGSYRGGRMLFIGLGTGFGSALVWNGTVLPLELSELPYLTEGTIEDRVGKAGFKRVGRKTWEEDVDRILVHLQRAFVVDYIVIGGGNAKMLEHLPPAVELGHNRNAYLGGQRVWQHNQRTRRPRWKIL
ncbi:MAG TPA: ROK family protein [Chthoniobacterales bacterium]|nr:ROK family protein [Chthoniobacterales bacterium]